MNLENKPNSGSFDHFCQLPIEKIVPSRLQPRKYFSGEGMEQLVASVRQCGILEPLIVRSLSEDRFELVAGERRYRAAELAGLDTVPAMVREMDDAEALECALTENILRENLNPIEETEGILQLLSARLKCELNEVTSLLYQLQNQEKKKTTRSASGNANKAIVEEVFADIGRMNWKSFVRTRLPLLKLHQEILEALRRGEIEYTKAKEIDKLDSESERVALLEEAIAQKLTLRQVQKLVREKKASEGWDELQTRMEAVARKIKRLKLSDDPAKQAKLDSWLTAMEKELEALLGSEKD